MYFAHITDGSVDQVGAPPRKVGDVYLLDLNPDTLASFGWFAVAEAPRPADSATVTYEVEVHVDEAGLPVEVWVSRPWTALELAARSAEADRDTARTAVRAIAEALRAEKDRVQLVIDAPNADIKTNPANYVKDVARASKRIADAAIDLARLVG